LVRQLNAPQPEKFLSSPKIAGRGNALVASACCVRQPAIHPLHFCPATKGALMTWFLFDCALLVAGYVLAVVSWPKLRLYFITLRDDPIGAIEKDIAALRALAQRLEGH
jgi:hypothetical protein